jgi:hypothetical protein
VKGDCPDENSDIRGHATRPGRDYDCGRRPATGDEYTPANGRHLPEYTKESDLILPKNWRSWVYVGSPLTPDALNNGMAGFPESHNVYI